MWDVREKLAGVAHSIRAKGVNDLLNEGCTSNSGYEDLPGYAIKEFTDRLVSPFELLTDSEKDINRAEADKMLAAIADCGAAGSVSDGYHTFDELYEYRKLYNAALFNEWALLGIHDVHKSTRHSDGEECFGGGWFVVVATLPSGQISNHYKMGDYHLFRVPEREKAIEWDGHTPKQAAERLRKFLEKQS
jgi:hypothetical protein